MMKVQKKYIGEDCVCILRGIITLVLGLVLYHRETVQLKVNELYGALLQTELFYSVYFETFFATACYTIIITFHPRLVSNCTHFDVFKISMSVTNRKHTPREKIRNLFY